MAYSKNFRTPAQLTAVARAAFRVFIENYLVSGLLPIESVYDIDFTYGDVTGALPAAATYRAYGAESGVGEMPAGSSKRGALPPISQRHPVDEYLKLTLYGQNDAIGAAFDARAERSAQAVAARVILAAYEAITAGAVTINENGQNFTVAFGRKSTLTANAATPWSTIATADPISDLEALRAIYGRPMGRVVVSNQAATYLQQNVNLIKTVLGRGTDLPGRISFADVQSVFSDFRLGQIVVNEELVTNKAGAVVSPVAADKVLILPAGGQVGTTKVGIAAQSIDSENGINGSERAGLFAGALQTHDAEVFNVLVSGIVLPVLTDPDATAVIDAF